MKAKSLIGAIVIATMSAVQQSCIVGDADKFVQEKKGYIDSPKWGKVINKELDLSDFNAVHICSNVDIIYTQGEEYKASIEGNEKAIECYRIKVDNRTLTDKKVKNVLGNIPSVRLHITAPMLNSIEVDGSGDFDIKDSAEFESLSMTVSGVGDIDIDNMECDELNVCVSGAGDVDIKNVVCKSVKVLVSGAGDVDFRKMNCNGKVSFDCSGAGDIDAKVKCPTLWINSKGAGDMKIDAECDFINAEASGTGDIEISGYTQELQRKEGGLSKVDTKKLKVDKFIKQ